jgi:hypothetical protein
MFHVAQCYENSVSGGEKVTFQKLSSRGTDVDIVSQAGNKRKGQSKIQVEKKKMHKR